MPPATPPQAGLCRLGEVSSCKMSRKHGSRLGCSQWWPERLLAATFPKERLPGPDMHPGASPLQHPPPPQFIPFSGAADCRRFVRLELGSCWWPSKWGWTQLCGEAGGGGAHESRGRTATGASQLTLPTPGLGDRLLATFPHWDKAAGLVHGQVMGREGSTFHGRPVLLEIVPAGHELMSLTCAITTVLHADQ